MAVTVGAAVGVAAALAPAVFESTPVTPTQGTSSRAPVAEAAVALLPASAPRPALRLPFGTIDADLSAMPDRYVNEPLPASFRTALRVRGLVGVASVDPPAAIVWTEGGVSYVLTSSARSISQLVELASQLR